MANIPISQLDTTSTRIKSNDLMLLSAHNNDDTYTSSKFRASNFVRPLCTIEASDDLYVKNETEDNEFHIPVKDKSISELKTEAKAQTTDLGDGRYGIGNNSDDSDWWYHCDTFMTADRDGWLLIWGYGDNKPTITNNTLSYPNNILQFCLSLQTHDGSAIYDTVAFSNLDYYFQSYHRSMIPIAKGTKCRLEFRFFDSGYQTMPIILANYRFFHMI